LNEGKNTHSLVFILFGVLQEFIIYYCLLITFVLKFLSTMGRIQHWDPRQSYPHLEEIPLVKTSKRVLMMTNYI